MTSYDGTVSIAAIAERRNEDIKLASTELRVRVYLHGEQVDWFDVKQFLMDTK